MIALVSHIESVVWQVTARRVPAGNSSSSTSSIRSTRRMRVGGDAQRALRLGMAALADVDELASPRR